VRHVFSLPDWVHTPSRFLHDAFTEYRLHNANFEVLPTGIWPFEVLPRKARRPDELRVGYLAALDYRKGLPDLLEAIEIYRSRPRSSQTRLRFLIYGEAVQPACYDALRSTMEKIDTIEYRGGFEPEKRSEVFSDLDVLVVPSRGENYPFVLREALYASVPVIASNIAGVPEIVQHGRNGLLFPAGDVEALAQIFTDLSEQPRRLQELSQQATPVKTIDQEAREIAERLQRLCGAHPSPSATTRRVGMAVPKTVREDPLETLFEQAAERVRQGHLVEGLKGLTQVLAKNPGHLESLKLVGDVYQRLGRKEAAVEMWRLALAQNPDDLTVLRRLGEPVACSIVIPVFNQRGFLERCITTLRENTPEGCYEIIAVDNHSTDGAREFLQQCEEVRLIANPENLGFAKACNQGARAARYEMVLFLNSDVEVRSGWLEPLVLTLLRDPDVGVVGSKLLYPDGRIQHAGVIIVDDRQEGQPLKPWHVYYRLSGSFEPANEPRVYPAVTGACLLTRKNLFEELGGFDTGFRNGFEDVDYCLKASKRGVKVVYRPESVAIHYESSSGKQRFLYETENYRYLAKRWQGKFPADVRRWRGVEDFELLKPFQCYKPAAPAV